MFYLLVLLIFFKNNAFKVKINSLKYKILNYFNKSKINISNYCEIILKE